MCLAGTDDVFPDGTIFVAGSCADARDVQACQFNVVFHGIRVESDDLRFYLVSFKYAFECGTYFFFSVGNDIRESERSCAAVYEVTFFRIQFCDLVSVAGV